LYLKVLSPDHLVQSGFITVQFRRLARLSEHRLTKANKTSTTPGDAAAELDPSLPDTFEAALAELETLVATMESGSLALEQSLTAYARGVALTRLCQQKLAQAEQQVKVLEAGMLRPFEGLGPDAS
jgi:exodeoxyribonuclease VII small subunit